MGGMLDGSGQRRVVACSPLGQEVVVPRLSPEVSEQATHCLYMYMCRVCTMVVGTTIGTTMVVGTTSYWRGSAAPCHGRLGAWDIHPLALGRQSAGGGYRRHGG